MKLHGNARTCPNTRALIAKRVLKEGWSLTQAAEAAGVSERTAWKWVDRFRREGWPGLADRSSAPGHIPHRTPPGRVRAITALRRLRMTAAEIAEILRMALSTVSAILKRVGLGKRSRLEPPEPPNRYERRKAGELVHVDVKKLGRIVVAGHRVTSRAGRVNHMATIDGRRKRVAGWEFVHVVVDDATRLAYAEVLANEKGPTAAGFLRRALSWFGAQGVVVERVMSDNGACYRSRSWELACRELRLRHIRTRPYRPRTNGKAERFIQTLLREWAYARIYASSLERSRLLGTWIDRYNYSRPHGSLSHRPPAARLSELMNNQRGNYT